MQTNPYPSSPGMWPLRVALRHRNVRIDDRTFEAACVAGDIPIRIERLGVTRKRFIRVDELDAWLHLSST